MDHARVPGLQLDLRGDLDPKLVENLQRVSRFIPTSPEAHKSIEQAAKSAGLIKD